MVSTTSDNPSATAVNLGIPCAPPIHFDLHVATDVEDATRVEPQLLVMHVRGLVAPWIPSNAITRKVTLFKLLLHFGEGHIEIPCQEFGVMGSNFGRESIPKCNESFWPLEFHSSVMAMNSCHDDVFASVSDILFETDFGRHDSGPGRYQFFNFVCTRGLHARYS